MYVHENTYVHVLRYVLMGYSYLCSADCTLKLLFTLFSVLFVCGKFSIQKVSKQVSK